MIDLVTSDLREEHPDTAVVRLDQLYPFPRNALEDLLEAHSGLQRIRWVQEEPLNMGAWDFLRPRLRKLIDLPLRGIGRPIRSSPAEGSSTQYRVNQSALIEGAFELEEGASAPGVSVVNE